MEKPPHVPHPLTPLMSITQPYLCSVCAGDCFIPHTVIKGTDAKKITLHLHQQLKMKAILLKMETIMSLK
jgi:hypothetical protein